MENLPGFPVSAIPFALLTSCTKETIWQDNIRFSPSSKTLFVGLAGLRHADEFSLFDALGEAVWIRKLSRLIPDRFLAKVLLLTYTN